MLLQKLRVERLRNLQAVVLNELQPFNVFYGQNGSGKTSLLEAIHLLAVGRSFRTYIPKHYIQNQTNDTVIFAQSQDYRIGLQKMQSGEQVMKVNGDTVATQGQLAKLLPVQVLEPQSTDIIDHGAKPRRQMLDWLLFHIEPDFFPIWQSYARALKQRNSLLKMYPIPKAQVQAWNHILAQEGERIHTLRELVVERWQQEFAQELKLLLPTVQVDLDYFAGFSTEMGLAQQLEQEINKDMERKTTQHGVHRADLRLKTPLGYADDVLSRGQKKLLIIALKLSQISLLNKANKETVVLLDDLSAELDVPAQQRLIARLAELGSQVFVTVLEPNLIKNQLEELDLDYKMFHVEHGKIL